MSTDVHEELEAAGGAGDALDGPTGGDDGGEAPPDGGSWLEGADDETREYAASKGWDKDPSGAIKAHREATQALTESRQNLARMEGRLSQLEQERQAGAAPAGPQQSPEEQQIGAYLRHHAELYEQGQIDTAQWAEVQAQVNRAYAQLDAEAAVAARTAPIEQKITSDSMATAAKELADQYGEEFTEHSDEVLELINRHKNIYGSVEGMHAAFGLVQARKHRAQAEQNRRAARTETLTQSARSDTQAADDAAAAIIKQLDEVRGASSARDPLG